MEPSLVSLDEHKLKNPQFSPSEYSFIEKIKSVNENGQAIPLKRMDVKQEQSYYWNQKINSIGLIIALSTLYFIVTILDKSNLFQVIWDAVISTIWGFLLHAVGMA